MGTLVVFNLILILIITGLLIAAKKFVRGERAQRATLLIAPLVTIAIHYSLFFYHLCFTGGAVAYLADTPNLILPMYPCNVVMWCALFYGLLSNKESKLALFLSDYVFWFGLLSTLVGMFAKVDFITNPTLADFEVTKSIVAHATLLFNLLLIPVFGLLRPCFFRNMKNMLFAVIGMYVIGLYCNLIFEVFVSAEKAFDENSMFIIHSPFEGAPFLRYPLIAALGLVAYLILFTVCDILRSPRGSRWYDRALAALRKS
ncbi:MAG: hypothetical protein IJW22_03015 [Clostridia bacterium]|nr:hypothetical protein [Clostridia bacterium]